MLVSHENLVAECFIPSELWREHLGRRKEREEPPFEYRTLAHLPAAHIAGVQGYLINPLYMGGTVFWMPKFDFGKFLEYNKLFQITFFFSVPPIFLLIAKMPIVTDQFDSLEFAVSGAGTFSVALRGVSLHRNAKSSPEQLHLEKRRSMLRVRSWGKGRCL